MSKLDLKRKAHPLVNYVPVAEAIARLFAPQTEVVIHELATDRIYHIANPLSGRKPGDESLLKLDQLGGELPEEVLGPYEKAGNRGERVIAITAALRDPLGKAVGLMCINADYSRHEQALHLLEGLLGPPLVSKRPEVLFRNDWRDQIKLEIRELLSDKGASLADLTPEFRRELIGRIEAKGLFYARRSADQLATLLGVSRATVYKDLSEIRRKEGAPQ